MLEFGWKPLLLIIAALALILLNALWVAAEFAIVRVRRTRLEELVGQGVAPRLYRGLPELTYPIA